jgi:Flp pilus assembly pilin Flp
MNILRRRHRGPVQDPALGASAAEYALVVSLIAVVIIVSVALFGGEVAGLFDEGQSCIETPSAC